MADLFERYGGLQPQQQPQQQRGGTDLLGDFLVGASQGATFGFADELYGIGAGLIPGGQNREEATRSARQRLKDADPKALLAGEIAGSFAVPGLGVARGATLGARAARGALAGGIEGGVGAFGRSEGDFTERAQAVPAGAGAGAALGGVGAAAIPAALDGVRRLVDRRQSQTAARQLVETTTRLDDIGDAGREAVGALQRAHAGAKEGVNAAYAKVAKLEGRVEDRASFSLLANKFNRLIEDEGIEYLEGGDRVIRLADDTLSALENGASVQNIDNARKKIAKLGRAETARQNFDTARLYNGLREEFDNWMFDTLTNKLYRGDEQAVETIKAARETSRRYHEIFGIGGRTSQDKSASRMINQIIKDGVEANEAVNLLFGLNGLGKTGARKALARIRDASPEAFHAMQGAHAMKLLTGEGGGDFLPAAAIKKNINKALFRDKAMMQTLYGDDLSSFVRFANNLGPGPVADKVANFLRSKPALLTGILGLSAGGGAYAASGDPYAGGFTGLIVAGLTSRLRGGAPATANQLQRAARPSATAGANAAANIGGTLGGIYGGNSQ